MKDPSKEIAIDELIKALKNLKQQGVTKVKFQGTLLAIDKWNSIILSTEPQM
jgi:hypothetical protein